MIPLLDLSGYAHVLVLDTQVILEAKPLGELPWNQIGSDPILLLCTPKMLTEVDRWKRDGRIGKRSRYFNRLVEPAIGSQFPITIVDGPPRVDIALITPSKINWSTMEDLDPDEGDDRIVAEALHAQVTDVSKLTVFSYDLRPRAAAARHGMAALKPNENWLYAPDPTPADKESQRLRQRVQELEATQPSLVLTLETQQEKPIRAFRVSPIDGSGSKMIIDGVLDKHPHRGSSINIDFTYDERYAAFEQAVRMYPQNLPAKLEDLYNQRTLLLRLEAHGAVAAQHVEIQIRAHGAILDRKLKMGFLPPTAPSFRSGIQPPYFNKTIADLIPQRVSRNEITFDPLPDRTDVMRLTCEDFRHGRSYERRIYVTIDPRFASSARIEARVTAGNLNGEVRCAVDLPFETVDVVADDLISFDEFQPKEPLPLARLLQKLVTENNDAELDRVILS